jgi:hypothetical protein
VLARQSKSFPLTDCISVGVDRIQLSSLVHMDSIRSVARRFPVSQTRKTRLSSSPVTRMRRPAFSMR